MKKRVAILISGRGSNMTALIEAARAEDYPAEIALVISNRPQAAGLDRARSFGIPTMVIDHTLCAGDRAAFEQTLDRTLRDDKIDLICLAGFMRLLTPWFVLRWSGRMLNIHPSLLPQFKGLNTHRRALAAGAERHGATVHFVVAEMDAGPIVAQESIAVRADDTEETLAARVLELEHRIYPRALCAVAHGQTTV
jgi:phosphoribosylglycinamide formyltransferase 1